jgi:hypothetical protein
LILLFFELAEKPKDIGQDDQINAPHNEAINTEKVFPLKAKPNESIESDAGYGGAQIPFNAIAGTSGDYQLRSRL